MVDETRAFAIRPQLAKLTETYPGPQDVLDAAAVGEREKAILARLWISEGIPFAFRGCPGLYEEVRDWLAKGLELDAKQISVRGQRPARILPGTKEVGRTVRGNVIRSGPFRRVRRLVREIAGGF